MPWFSLNLGDALLAEPALERIKNQLLSDYGSLDAAADKAVFIRHESEGRLHCEVIVYFSPAMATLATAVGAQACEKPSPDGLGLLSGSEAARSVLFTQAG